MLQGRSCPGMESKQMLSACGSADRGSLGRGRELSTVLLCPGRTGALLLLQGGEGGQGELEDAVP